MSSFLHCIETAQLHPITQKGASFTWTNNHKDDWLVMEKLDRALSNNLWLQTFPFSHTHSLGIAASDHSPLIFNSEFSLKPMKQRKFELFWLLSKECEDIIRYNWNQEARGSPSFDFKCKLQRTLDALYAWSRSSIGNFSHKIKRVL